jgi:signal transduction histidine kinase/ligand-binding sensor domain-containing protein/CheY-like chemotaxis protein
MWFATYNGINRYDGYTFKVYRNIPNDKNSISDNGTTYLYQDKQGYIWIVNNGNQGVDRFDPKTEKFTRFKYSPKDSSSISSNQVYHVTEDREGNLWVSTKNALNLVITKTENGKSTTLFKRFYYPFVENKVIWVLDSKHTGLLLLTSNLYHFDRKKGKFTRNKQVYNNSDIMSVCEDKSGNIWIGTLDFGLRKLTFDIKTNNYQPEENNIVNIAPNERNYLIIDNENNIWIATSTHGLYKYNEQKNNFVHYLNDKNNSNSISDNTIHSLYIDHSGVLWAGTFSQGLCKLDLNNKAFAHYKANNGISNRIGGNVVSSIHSRIQGELWVGFDLNGGLDRLVFNDTETPQIIHYRLDLGDANKSTINSILSLVQRRNGEVWATSAGGFISTIKPGKAIADGKGIIKTYKLDRWTFSIYEDSQGVLWGGTWGNGIWRFDDKTETFTTFQNKPNDPSSVCDNVIWSIIEDNIGNIWIGGHGEGLSILPVNEKYKPNPKFLNYKHNEDDTTSISNNTIHSFCQDHMGNMWIGTSGGLNKVKTRTGSFKQIESSKLEFSSYHINNGLPSETVVGILEDNKGNLWLSTPNGLSNFNTLKNIFVNYNEKDGLQGNEFWHNSYFKNSNGKLYFGGNNGFNSFFPDSIKLNKILPKIVFTDFRIFNQLVKVGEKINGDIILSKSINETSRIVLSHKNNAFNIEFAALHYAQPNKNNYAYKLEGFDKQWNFVGNKHEATYTNLDYGKYTFSVIASNNDGYWDKTGKSFEIVILPPWWKHWWFRILLILIIAVSIGWFFYYRLSFFKDQKNKLEEMVYKRTFELEDTTIELEEKQEEINQQKEELLSQRDALYKTNLLLENTNNKIVEQNNELYKHRYELELLIEQRTHELIVAKEKAEESDRLKSSFLANLSHEIRTPLNAIMGFSTLIAEGESSKEDVIKFNQIIQNSGISLLSLIEDIIDFSKIESGYINIVLEKVPLQRILENISIIYNLQLKKSQSSSIKNIEFKVITGDDIENIYLTVDEVRLNQILSNLINNAIKFTQQGTIEVGYKINKEGHIIEFYVKDTGIGIKKENLQFIFLRFRKVEDNSTEIHRGAGLGLSIAQQLVNILGGTIYAESEPMKGSTFFFTLPLSSENSPQPAYDKPLKINHLPDLKNLKIIIAEDDEANFAYIQKLVQRTGCIILHANNGKQVLFHLEKNPDIAFILMDIKMPIMDGIEALKEIRKRGLSIPVIAQTAYALADEINIFKEAGFNEYLTKPIISSELFDRINKILKT